MTGHDGTEAPQLAPAALDSTSLGRIASEDAVAARAHAADRVKIQASIADAMMKALLWANGGAMVALFTFIGNVAAKTNVKLPFDGRSIWIAFALFVAGLIVALLCHFAAFISQDRYYTVSMHEAWRQQAASVRQVATTPSPVERTMHRHGPIAYVFGMSLALVSTVLFATGCGFALAGVLIR